MKFRIFLVDILTFVIHNCEPISSLLWFAMDFFWMVDVTSVSKLISVPAVIFGGFVLAVNLQAEGPKITNMPAVAGFLWLLMNVFWMFDMKFMSLLMGSMGVACLVVAMVASPSLKAFIYGTFSRFRK